jgi:hypothetical protein
VRPVQVSLAALCAVALAGCGNTLQDRPIPHNELETLIVAPFPVYWLGKSFHGLAITGAEQDPGGAYWVQYGDCVSGGQSSCVPTLRIVTSPDNSFLPGGAGRTRTIEVRGVTAMLAVGGRTIVIPTGRVVVDIYAIHPSLALAAVHTLAPINALGWPREPLPKPLPDSGYGSAPLPSQVPTPVRVIG